MTTAAADYAASINDAWRAFLERGARATSPHGSIYASAFRVCDRRMAFELTQPDTLPAFPADTLAKFRRGEDRERDLLADLTRIGRDADPPFKVTAQQERFVLRDRKSRPAIVGKVDARLDLGGGVRAPLEIKAWSPLIVDRIQTFADLFANPWTQSGAHQLLSYLFGAGEPFGFLLLDRSGLPKLLPVELEPNLDRVETFLTKAERVLDAVDAGTLPPFLADDPTECRRCPWYGAVCNPPLEYAGAAVLTDPDLEAALERRDAIKAIGKEYADLDADVKARLRGVTAAVVGKFAIAGRWGNQSRVDLPPDLKRQYTTTDPHGRFTLDIQKIG